MIPIAKPLVGKEELEGVRQVLDSGMLAHGPVVERFEKKFAEYIGTKHAIATSNGTTALHTAFLASGIRPGDEVILPSFTFFATASSVLMAGAKPVIVDVDYDTFNIDLEKVKEAITSKTKFIEPVHLYGSPCDMKALQEIAQDHNIQILEDACQAHGAEIEGQKVGSLGIAGCFSFYPTKNMTTAEGGMITTNDDEVARKARVLLNHGQEGRYNHTMLGYNYRLTSVQAAIGIAQLEKLSEFNRRRIENATRLTQELTKITGIKTPEVVPKTKHVFHQYTIRVTDEFGKTRDNLLEYLTQQGIGTGIYYKTPLHQQQALKQYVTAKYPVTEMLASQVISLPIHPEVTEDAIRHIANVIGNAQRNNSK